MRLEENTPPAIVEKFTWDAVVMDEIRGLVYGGFQPGLVLIDGGWPWLSIRPNHHDLATEGMNKFGPGPNTRGMKDTHTRLHYVCFGIGNAPGWLSARPEYEVIGLLLTPKQQMYEGMPPHLESTGIDLGAINDMVYENYDYQVMAIRVHDPPGDPFWLQGCNVAANKHLWKDLGQATVRSAEVADKKAEGGRIEQAKWDSKKRGIAEAKAKEEAGEVLICMGPKAAVSTNMASSFWDKLPKLLSASTKFVRGVLKLLARISLKKGLVIALLVFKPPVVSSVNTCYSVSVVASPPSPRALIMAPPPPLPPSPQTLNMAPSRVTKRGARRLGPRSPSKRSDLTESKTEWGLPPKRSPPSCLPNC